MTMPAVQKQTPEIEMVAQIRFGKKALHELRTLITGRQEKEKLVVGGKQYLFFHDWQTLGAFFGITAYVMKTEQLTEEKEIMDGKMTVKAPIGYWARAVAFQNGKEISAAEAICLKSEKNWGNKDTFQLLSMAQTRASAKCLRNVLSWVIKLPDEKQPVNQLPFSEESAEEVQ